MKISARNVLKGKVKSVSSGVINSEIIIEIPGGTEIVSIITNNSANNLQLTPGKEVYVIIKASNVIVAVD